MADVRTIDKLIKEYLNETQKMTMTFYDKDIGRDVDVTMKEIIERALEWEEFRKTRKEVTE